MSTSVKRALHGRRKITELGWSILAVAAALVLAAAQAWPQDRVQVVTDGTSYNVGSDVQIEVIFPSSQPILRDFLCTLRYAGDSQPVLDQVPLARNFMFSGRTHATGYRELWKIPPDARTGRYEVDLAARDLKTHETLLNLPAAVSFVVHRKLVRIERIGFDRSFYTSGEHIRATVTVANLTDQPLTGLRVEFSNRYWPWIVPPSDRAGLHIVTVNEALFLPPNARRILAHAAAAIAEAGSQPTIRQYAVVVWDHDHKNIYDIAFSPFALIQPPGVTTPKPYPGQYASPDPGAMNFTNYRHFYPPRLDSAAIQFDHSHTMWPAGGEAKVSFSVVNPTEKPWQRVSVRCHLLGPDGAETASKVVAETAALDAGAAPLRKDVTFTLPTQAGVYRAEAEVSDRSGQVLAANSLELGVNALPKSILVFCAHEDDEGGHPGLYRAAVENHIPIHFLYYTSGDAGSCDRYYQHSCDPAEALNFGTIRMQEVRGALGHLGVSQEDISFLGLPDGGSGEIWYSHQQPANPYFGVLLGTDHSPYEGVLQPNLPYARESVVGVTKEFIKKFQPDVIYTAHPGDVRHIDHIVTNYFVVAALQQLAREGTPSRKLTLLVDGVHDPKSQPATPYRYQDYIFHVSGEVKALGQEAGWFHQSQGGTHAAANIRTYNQLPRAEIFREVLDWKEHEGWNEKTESSGR